MPTATASSSSQSNTVAVSTRQKAPRRGLRRTETCASTLPYSLAEHSNPAVNVASAEEDDPAASSTFPASLQPLIGYQHPDEDEAFAELLARVNNATASVQELIDLFPLPNHAPIARGETFNDDSELSVTERPDSSLHSTLSDLRSSFSDSDYDEASATIYLDPDFPGHKPCSLYIESVVGYSAQHAIKMLLKRFEAAQSGPRRHKSLYTEWRDHKDMMGKNGQIHAYWGPSPLSRGLKDKSSAKFKRFVDVDCEALGRVENTPGSAAKSGGNLDRSPAVNDMGRLVVEDANGTLVDDGNGDQKNRSDSTLEDSEVYGDENIHKLAGIENETLFTPSNAFEKAPASPRTEDAQNSRSTPDLTIIELIATDSCDIVEQCAHVRTAPSTDTIATTVQPNIICSNISIKSRSSTEITGDDSNKFIDFMAARNEQNEYEEARSRFLVKTVMKIVVEEPKPVLERMEDFADSNEAQDVGTAHANPGYMGCFGVEVDLLEKVTKQIEQLDVKAKAQEGSQKLVETLRSWVPKFWGK
ncbi:hypothetical protein NX059_000925 [Plenodomus lindquistii]|nr:hypothetical protein NX059_000925 [Plenodomus lindquistii]